MTIKQVVVRGAKLTQKERYGEKRSNARTLGPSWSHHTEGYWTQVSPVKSGLLGAGEHTPALQTLPFSHGTPSGSGMTMEQSIPHATWQDDTASHTLGADLGQMPMASQAPVTHTPGRLPSLLVSTNPKLASTNAINTKIICLTGQKKIDSLLLRIFKTTYDTPRHYMYLTA
jgi:hypothetical protein